MGVGWGRTMREGWGGTRVGDSVNRLSGRVRPGVG